MIGCIHYVRLFLAVAYEKTELWKEKHKKIV